MKERVESLVKAAENYREDMTRLVRDLVRTPSESGNEGEVADVLEAALRRLGMDLVFRDKFGNVVGVYKGTGGGENLMFNCHMDQVATGNLADWQYPPFDGVVAEGFVHGRGASDTKGAMAAQIYGVHLLAASGTRLRGDIYLTFVIDEEPGDMWGMQMLGDSLKDKNIAFCVLGEATGLDIFLGHRGRVEIELRSTGIMSHSSAPRLGINAVDKMVKVLTKAANFDINMADDAFLGRATQSTIHISCLPGSLSTVPDYCLARIDRRYVPSESAEEIVSDYQELVAACKKSDPEIKVEVGIRKTSHTSYTGISGEGLLDKPAYLVPTENPFVQKTVAALKAAGQNPAFGKWDFGTDGAYTNNVLGIPTIGYSCCEEKYTHSSKDRVDIDALVKCAAGTASICLHICS